MALEEKRAWIMLAVSGVAYAVYAVIVLWRADDAPIADVAYVSPLLWTVGAACLGAIVLNIAAGIFAPKGDSKKDERDREIFRLGEYIGHSFVVIGGVAALIMALAETKHFWIANVIYLMFFLSSILGSVAKIFAYRRGFQSW